MEPSRGKSLCVPCASDDHYAACVAEPECVRRSLGALHSAHPELCPERFAEGFRFHDQRWSLTQQRWSRRSPFHDLNGFESHPNWLHNLLIASSMGGRRR